MSFRILLSTILFFLLAFVIPASGQDSSGVQGVMSEFPDSLFTVERIVLVGNSHTKDFVILREMSLQPGTPITRELLEYNKNRIYSLGLFNQVQMKMLPSSSGKAVLTIEVSERWYVFPYPIFGIKDRDWDKVYYGVGVAHTNFRGRNEKVFTTVVFGYDPSFGLSYRNPFLSEEGLYFLETKLTFNKVRNKSVQAQVGLGNFDERHYAVGASVGRRFGIHHTAWISGGYEIVDISEFLPGRTISPDGKDSYPILGAGYVYDTRDLAEYPAMGAFIRLAVTKSGFPGNDFDIVRYAIDMRKYTPLGSNVTWTIRAFADLVAAGRTPSYYHAYFGYGERIRGHFKEVTEGENLFGISSELHVTLLPVRYFKVDFLPTEFSVLKFGIVATAFADAGTVWFRGTPFAVEHFVRGYGVGLNFLLPYSAVVRTEYAWNESRRGQLILDVGTTF